MQVQEGRDVTASSPERGWTLVMRTGDLIWNYAARMGNTSVDRITFAQQNVLAAVYCHEGPGVRVKDIASELHLTPGAVSQTVEALVKEGIVERVPDPSDRRAVLVRPSAKGMKIRQTAAEHIGGIMREIMGEVSEDDIHGFLTVINLLMEKLSHRYEKVKRESSVRIQN